MSKAPDIIGSATPVDSTFWMQAAQAVVRRFCGWHVAPSVTETLKVTGSGGRRLTLPSGHVTGLSKVSVCGTVLDIESSMDWDQAGVMVLRPGMGLWPDVPGAVEVTLTHGWDPDEVPEVAALIATLAQRAASGPGVVASQSVNGASVAYLTAGGAPLGIPLLEIEKETLAPYCLVWGPLA